jgi:hypothetical protein
VLAVPFNRISCKLFSRLLIILLNLPTITHKNLGTRLTDHLLLSPDRIHSTSTFHWFVSIKGVFMIQTPDDGGHFLTLKKYFETTHFFYKISYNC